MVIALDFFPAESQGAMSMTASKAAELMRRVRGRRGEGVGMDGSMRFYILNGDFMVNTC